MSPDIDVPKDSDLEPPVRMVQTDGMKGGFWKSREFFWFPVAVALLSGILTLGLGYAGVVTIDDYFPKSVGEIWNSWDTRHYLDIVRLGYSKDPDLTHLTGYLPLFPALIWIASLIFQDSTIAALVVSNVAFAVALVFLGRLAAKEFPAGSVEKPLIFCAFFPAAYFFHLGYTESLYLALSLGAFYYARRGQWWQVAVFGFLAGMTRLPGFLLAPALVVEYLHQKEFRLPQIRWDGLFALCPIVGFGVYLGINWLVQGDPFRFLEIHRQISVREFALPWSGFVNDWIGLFTASPATRFFVNFQNVLAFFFTLVVLAWSAFRLRPSYTVYMALLWLITFSYSFWMSIPRLILVIFPIYFFLAQLTEKRPALRYSLIMAFLFPYVIGTIQFARGWWAN